MLLKDVHFVMLTESWSVNTLISKYGCRTKIGGYIDLVNNKSRFMDQE